MQQTKTYYKFVILDTLIWRFKINHQTTTTIRTELIFGKQAYSNRARRNMEDVLNIYVIS